MTQVLEKLEHDGRVLRLILASPPANILDAQAMAAIQAAIEQHRSDPALRLVVFEGQGKHFSFGASVEEHQKAKAPEMIRGFHGLFKTLLATDLVFAALVRGQCLGGALELVSFCQFVIAEPSARFAQPEIKLGVLPPVAAVILPAVVGQLRADDLVLTGRSIDASTAHLWGLVHHVAEDAEAALQTALLKEHLLDKSASSLRLACRAVRSVWRRELPARLDEMERLYLDELMTTHDANEGIASFLEKRKPTWKN